MLSGRANIRQRYAEISGYDGLDLCDFTAIVISSDLRRTGTFECSHALINKLHENTVWSMRGNFVSVPTDCPQRDERLGWTGDIQVFAPTANYLFDTTAFLGGWLRDLEFDQRDFNGVVPNIIPVIPIPPRHPEGRAMAVWADSAVTVPWELYTTSGDRHVLEKQFNSMCLWLDKGVPRDERGFYDGTMPQYGDWLDPRSPPHLPGHSPTDPHLVANAYLIYVTGLTGRIAQVLDKSDAAARYTSQAARLRELFRAEYMTPTGRLACDTQAAYAIALRFGLFDTEEELRTARSRLGWMVKWEAFKITTGFAATPIILQTLADNGKLSYAYRMLQERDCPSWLYPVGMGATTIVSADSLRKRMWTNLATVGTMELDASGWYHKPGPNDVLQPLCTGFSVCLSSQRCGRSVLRFTRLEKRAGQTPTGRYYPARSDKF
jgi:alpha-L-rhamnosidase